MYYIVEITSQGSETFLEGFEEVGEAWDVVSRLQCEARRQRRKVRYEVRERSKATWSNSHVAFCSAPATSTAWPDQELLGPE